MAQYTPPLRDMQFVLHELLGAVDVLKACPQHADGKRTWEEFLGGATARRG